MTPASNSIRMSTIRRGWLVAFGLVAVILFLPISCAVDPLLYTAKNASATGFHQDLAVTGDLTRNDAALVLQEWAAGLNLTGPLVHNIHVRDFESADIGLQRYVLSAQSLNDLVAQLDLTDTDVAALQDDHQANLWSLSELLDQTKEYDDLQIAETAFRDQKNISGLKSVELQGEELSARIQSNYEGYAYRSGKILSLSQKFGMNTSEFEQSVIEFAAIATKIGAVQDRRSSSIQGLIEEIQSSGQESETCGVPSAIRLKILPDHGAYGDILSLSGTVGGPGGSRVTVFVDGLKLGDVVTDRIGRFSFSYRIEQVEARNHTAYASVGSDISDVSNFTVTSENTALSLAARLIEENGTWKSIGTGRLVTEDGVPVRGARVYVDVDGRTSWRYGITGDDGVYTVTSEQLSSRVHTLKARFDPDRFPLNSSESAPVTIEVSSHFGWLAALVYLFGVGGAAVGGVIFLRTRYTIDTPSSPSHADPVPACPAKALPARTIEEARMIADRATVIKEGHVDGYETIAQTYRQLVRELEERRPALRLRSRTPRDLALLFADQPCGDHIAVLVGIHERIRYAEHKSTEDDLHRTREAFIQVIMGGGARH